MSDTERALDLLRQAARAADDCAQAAHAGTLTSGEAAALVSITRHLLTALHDLRAVLPVSGLSAFADYDYDEDTDDPPTVVAPIVRVYTNPIPVGERRTNTDRAQLASLSTARAMLAEEEG